MTYSIAPFGDGVSNVVKNVPIHYGSLTSAEMVPSGTTLTVGKDYQKNFVTNPVALTATTSTLRSMLPVTIPAGAVIEKVIAKVDSAFSITGTSPVVYLGTSGTTSTNGVSITEAQLEAAGTYKLTPTGTWALPLAADTLLDTSVGGTSVVFDKTKGSVEFTIFYSKV